MNVYAALVRIRPALPDDVTVIDAIVQRAYRGYVSDLGVRPAPMDEDYAEKVRLGEATVASTAGEVVGVIVLIKEEDHVLVENVAVDPDRQGDGIGRALLARAELVAREAGTPELRLYTNAGMTENIALYRHLGYRETDRRSSGPFRRVFFSKRLDPVRAC